MIKILVTGSNGLLGQKITDLITAQYSNSLQLIATAKGPNRHPLKTGYVYEDLDITNTQAVLKIVKKHTPNFVIHGAAATNVDWCELNQPECYNINVTATENIVKACEETNTHLIYISTDFVFDGEKPVGGLYSEIDAPNPVSYYGHSKLMAENLVTKSSIKSAILRTVLVYGIVQDMSRSNIVLWVKNNLESKKQINVVNDQYRTPTLAEDLAYGAILACLKKAQGIYNISGKDYLNIYEIALKVADYFNLEKALILPSNSQNLKQDAKRPPRTGFDLSKSRAKLEYEPRSFEQGLSILEKQMI